MSEWQDLSQKELDYHVRQLNHPYRQTEAFADFIAEYMQPHKRIIDLCCGAGANLKYLKKRFPKCRYTGVDINEQLTAVARANIPGIRIVSGSIYDIEGEYHGALSYQTISWMDNWQEPIEKMVSLNPEFIGITSLFYKGDVDFMIRVINREEAKKSNYNVYSLKAIDEYFKAHGYAMIAKPYEIDIDLPKVNGMGTYTEKIEDGRRIQISGALLMPWYFILAVKEGD
jgi:trans-aconitate methyltransferase